MDKNNKTNKTRPLGLIDFSSNIPVRIKEKIEAFKSLEKLRMLLHKDLAYEFDLLDASGADRGDIKALDSMLNVPWSMDFNGHRIKISIPDFLPTVYIKTSNEAAAYFFRQWKMNTASFIKQSNQTSNLKYNKVFIWFKFFNSIKFDCDNRFFKPVIDGIHLSGLIKDDDNTIVKFGFEGIKCNGKSYTEVFIFGDENIPDLISKGIN